MSTPSVLKTPEDFHNFAIANGAVPVDEPKLKTPEDFHNFAIANGAVPVDDFQKKGSDTPPTYSTAERVGQLARSFLQVVPGIVDFAGWGLSKGSQALDFVSGHKRSEKEEKANEFLENLELSKKTGRLFDSIFAGGKDLSAKDWIGHGLHTAGSFLSAGAPIAKGTQIAKTLGTATGAGVAAAGHEKVGPVFDRNQHPFLGLAEDLIVDLLGASFGSGTFNALKTRVKRLFVDDPSIIKEFNSLQKFIAGRYKQAGINKEVLEDATSLGLDIPNHFLFTDKPTQAKVNNFLRHVENSTYGESIKHYEETLKDKLSDVLKGDIASDIGLEGIREKTQDSLKIIETLKKAEARDRFDSVLNTLKDSDTLNVKDLRELYHKNMSEHILEDIFKGHKKQIEQALYQKEALIDEVLPILEMPHENISGGSVIKDIKEALKEDLSKSYNDVFNEKLQKGVPLNALIKEQTPKKSTSFALEKTQPLLKDIMGNIDVKKGTSKDFAEKIKSIDKVIHKENVPLEKLHDLNKYLNLHHVDDYGVQSLLNSFNKSLKDKLLDSTQHGNEAYVKAFTGANQWFQEEVIHRLRTETAKEILNSKNPKTVLGKLNTVEGIKEAEKALGTDSPLFKELKLVKINQVFNSLQDEKGRILDKASPAKMQSILRDKKDILNALMEKEDIKTLDKIYTLFKNRTETIGAQGTNFSGTADAVKESAKKLFTLSALVTGNFPALVGKYALDHLENMLNKTTSRVLKDKRLIPFLEKAQKALDKKDASFFKKHETLIKSLFSEFPQNDE